MKSWSVMFAVVLMAASLDAAAARRLGGGESTGKQSSNVTQRQAALGSSAAPAPQSVAAQRPGSPATPAAAAAAPKKPWGAMLGGLAAGLGLAWLANSLGLGAEFGQFLLFALLALVIMAVVGLVLRARRGAGHHGSGQLALQGAGAPADLPPAAGHYNPEKVGNDASARPWERNSMAFEASKYAGGHPSGSAVGGAAVAAAGLGGAKSWTVPADFDAAGFVDAAKRNFVTLQSAWDRADFTMLRSMMTDEMLGEIRGELAERESARNGTPNTTEVVMLEAKLLGIEDLGQGYMASVEFSGMIREEPSSGPSPFREVWNMTKPKSGGGWLVAGVQALQ